jgi:hypothetical protein
MDQKMSTEVPVRTEREEPPFNIKIPAPTTWPIALAFGITLVFAGMLTTASVSILGAILAVGGYIGWFRDVLPHEKHESVPVMEVATPVLTSRPGVARVGWITHDLHRTRLPLETYPVSAGVKGGLAGSVAMAVLAMTYGILGPHSIWYPINLLSAGFFPGAVNKIEQLSAFHLDSFIIAAIVHLITSVLVGLLYGALLPMLPRHPILLGGVIAPILWSGLIHNMIQFLSPALSGRINWFWFVLSQLGFGVVAGLVVSRQERVPTLQNLPFPVRAGFEAPGAMDERNEGDAR